RIDSELTRARGRRPPCMWEDVVVDDVLAQSGLFPGLSEDAVDPVVSRLETVTLPRGRVVFNEGEAGDSLYVVLSGKIKLSRRSPDGRENVLAVMGPSDQFGELS